MILTCKVNKKYSYPLFARNIKPLLEVNKPWEFYTQSLRQIRCP